jgi:hypothetical protein
MGKPRPRHGREKRFIGPVTLNIARVSQPLRATARSLIV